MSVKTAASDELPLAVMITNTSAERVNYCSDTRDVCAIKVTSHCVFAWILIAPFILFSSQFLHSPSAPALLAIGCCHGDGTGYLTQPGQ